MLLFCFKTTIRLQIYVFNLIISYNSVFFENNNAYL